jgi:hypothetical protein
MRRQPERRSYQSALTCSLEQHGFTRIVLSEDFDTVLLDEEAFQTVKQTPSQTILRPQSSAQRARYGGLHARLWSNSL